MKKKQQRAGRDREYTLSEWCALADISIGTMRRWLKNTQLSVIKITGGFRGTRYFDSDLTAVMDEHR